MRQRYAIPLILVNGVVQYAGNFDSSLKFKVSSLSLTLSLTYVKYEVTCVVAVTTFDASQK